VFDFSLFVIKSLVKYVFVLKLLVKIGISPF